MISAGNGSLTVAGHTFTDSHGVGTVSYSQAMAHSSNVCAIKTGLSVGCDDFAALVRRMGFGTRTGVELPAEETASVQSPEKWNGDLLASMSIGYEIGVTALQMVTAFATIANDGVRIQPHIIKEIRPLGRRVESGDRSCRTQVLMAETTAYGEPKDDASSGRDDRNGPPCGLNGYSAAGKTGTAWKFNAVSKSVDSSSMFLRLSAWHRLTTLRSLSP